MPARVTAAVKEAMREYDDLQRKHPCEPVTEPVREQLAVNVAETATMGMAILGRTHMGQSPGPLWHILLTPGGGRGP